MVKRCWHSGLFIMLTLVFLLALTGCSAILKNIGAKIGDEIGKQVSNLTDGEDGETTAKDDATTKEDETTATKADVTEAATSVTDSGIEWPQDKMGDLPKLDAPISGVLNGEYGSVVSFAGVTKEQATEYIKAVKKLDYITAMESADAELIVFMGQKDVDGKTATCTISYDIKDQTAQITYLPE